MLLPLSARRSSTLLSQVPQQSLDLGGMISNIVFGLCACVIGGITIWQGYKTWMIWHVHGAPSGRSGGKTLDFPMDILFTHQLTLFSANRA